MNDHHQQVTETVAIKHRWSGSVIFECNVTIRRSATTGENLGAAVVAALRAGANLRGADLRGANLSLADLSGANLRGADLRGANLSGANLSLADMRLADLRGADLRGANLSLADLSGADLSGADLRGADLRGADLRGADLRGANLSLADLRGADLSGADLSGADLSGANLLCMGDMKFIRTMQIDRWAIGYTSSVLQIGCQTHEIAKWRKWNTEAGRKWIAQMDRDALEWANRNLGLVLAIIDANPAQEVVK